MRRRPLAISAVVLLLAGGATTAPTTAPLPLARWLDDLADPDPAVRDGALERLMGLPADALPRLLDAVRAARPLRPAQAAVLREVVTQAFLAADPYAAADDIDDPFDPTRGTRYVLGQNWPRGAWAGGADRMGVPVVNRWPGFPARRWLRDGDLILGLFTDPAAPPDRPPDLPTRTTSDLVQAMRDCPTRPRLTLSILRDGRVIRVSATMVAEPARTVGRRPAAVAGFLADRQHRADDYWDAHFAPVVDPPAATPLPNPADSHAR